VAVRVSSRARGLHFQLWCKCLIPPWPCGIRFVLARLGGSEYCETRLRFHRMDDQNLLSVDKKFDSPSIVTLLMILIDMFGKKTVISRKSMDIADLYRVYSQRCFKILKGCI
jgi:hypothetical protein